MISPIWYLDFCPRSRSTPGAVSFFLFLFNFEDAPLRLAVDEEGKNRSRSAVNEYGDSGAWMIVSQIMDSELGFRDDEGFSEGE